LQNVHVIVNLRRKHLSRLFVLSIILSSQVSSVLVLVLCVINQIWVKCFHIILSLM